MHDLIVSVIQSNVHWEDIDSNISMFDLKIDAVDEAADLIVLPEMFTTGFTMNAPKYSEKMKGPTVQWLLKRSAQKKAHITGSIIIEEKGKFFNRLIWVKPNGSLFTYDKRHLFRYAGEERTYSAGNRNITVQVKGWKVRPFICYDLRFPIWTRNLKNQYDIAIFTANWPGSRSLHWKTLLRSRAIENQCYVLGVNRVGTDGNGISYSGNSSLIDFKGDIIFEKQDEESILTAKLSLSDLISYRETFPFWKDADINENSQIED